VNTDETIRVYWQPGCTSCLRTKEFLSRHGVPFESRNVLADEEAYAELARFGLRQVPIVTRGDQWVNGQVLTDVARIAGIDLGGVKLLPVDELEKRLKAVLAGAQRYLGQMPDHALTRMLPNRPRSYADLSYHIFNIADSFLEHDQGIPLTFDSYNRVPASAEKGVLASYGRDVVHRLDAWFVGPGRSAGWNAKADVYYGEQTLHQFLWVLEGMGITPAGPLDRETWVGLPMPEKVWDDEKVG
jgi:glutaredoxin